MSIHFLKKELVFPDPDLADEDGLLAVGGDLSPERVLLAYRMGIFPWFSREPILWYSPDPRMILLPQDLYVGRSLRNAINRNKYTVRYDTAFTEVIRACARIVRPGQSSGTWITPQMLTSYCQLHEMGYAHSVEAWLEGELVGGLYGVSLGAAFFGESMFSYCSDASKVVFVHFVRQLKTWGFHFVDCQVYTEHLARFGAVMWSRRRFLRSLREALKVPTRHGPWSSHNTQNTKITPHK